MYAGIDKLHCIARNRQDLCCHNKVNASKQILKDFGIFDLFDGVYGVNIAEVFTKTDV